MSPLRSLLAIDARPIDEKRRELLAALRAASCQATGGCVPINRLMRATRPPVRANAARSMRSTLVVVERLEKNAGHEPPRAHLETT